MWCLALALAGMLATGQSEEEIVVCTEGRRFLKGPDASRTLPPQMFWRFLTTKISAIQDHFRKHKEKDDFPPTPYCLTRDACVLHDDPGYCPIIPFYGLDSNPLCHVS